MAKRNRARARDRARRRQRPSEPRGRAGRLLVGGLASLIVTALLFIGWLVAVYPKSAAPGRGRELRVELYQGMNVDVLASRLAESGAIESPRLFAVYARLLGADERFRTGEILLTDAMTPRDVLQRIAVGFGSATVRVTIPEGFHRFAIAARLERWGVCSSDGFLRATEDPDLLSELQIPGPSAEGYLFPDTYRLSPDLGPHGVVRRLVENFRTRTAPIAEEGADGLADLRETLGWGPHEVIILASIVEKEAAVSEERPTIARVFLNRLRSDTFRPRRLQADPTVSYGCLAEPSSSPSCADFSGHITRAMLSDRDNRYNTYRHEGLPPGPICSPGLDSIRAVLTAEPHRYLYFVARGGRRHTFSETLEQHNAAVRRWRRR